jgi:hypothetical protein
MVKFITPVLLDPYHTPLQLDPSESLRGQSWGQRPERGGRRGFSLLFGHPICSGVAIRLEGRGCQAALRS